MASDLQQRVLYHQSEPVSVQSKYNQFNAVDFLISVGEGRSLVENSVRICADLRVLSAPDTVSTAHRTFDRNVGGHAFFSNMSVSTQNQGLLENSQNYPRMVAQDSIASLNEYDLLDSKHQCELKATNQSISTDYCQGFTPTLGTGTAVAKDADFSIKPLMCLNKMDRDLPFSKSGLITVSANLARNIDAIFGQADDAATHYELRNIKLTFKSIPDPKIDSPVNMKVVHNVKSNILSGAATISVNVPAVCDSVAMNFIPVAHDSAQVFNSYKLENIKGFNEVQFMMNESVSNSMITYVLSDYTEILQRFIDAIEDTSHNQVSIDKFRANGGWGMGLKFDEPTDLSVNRFTAQIQSAVDNTYPVNVYMYFYASASI